MVFRRYLIIGIVLIVLVASYFLFFFSPIKTNDYNLYYNKLVSNQDFIESTDIFDITIDEELRDNSNYDYIVTFDNFSYRVDYVKILIIDENAINDENIIYFPSFGILKDEEYSFDKEENYDIDNNVLKGTNLIVLDKEKIDYFLIYFNYSNNELYLRIPTN